MKNEHIFSHDSIASGHFMDSLVTKKVKKLFLFF